MNKRLTKIRNTLDKENLNGCIIPTGDPHCSEYVSDYYKIREWASGFTGSSGVLVVTMTSAALWIDSRYYIQAEKELQDSGIYVMKDGLDKTPAIENWLNNHLDGQRKISINSELISYTRFEDLKSKLFKTHIELVPFDIVSKVWDNRPTLPAKPIFQLPDIEVTSQIKLKLLSQKIFENEEIDAHIVTSLSQICWLLNLRGADIKYTPLFLSYMFITENKTVLFVDINKLSENIVHKLENNNIEIKNYDEFYTYIDSFEVTEKFKILIDSKTMNAKVYEILKKRGCLLESNDISPLDKLKSIKNRTEIAGIKKALHKDSIALCNLIYNLEERICNEKLTEKNISEELLKLKSREDGFLEESFETISAYKENGAIVHYTPGKHSKNLKTKSFIVIDTGTQYIHGTTDSTRTIALGQLTQNEKHAYTIVLKSHINLADAIFPVGTSGIQLDTFARIKHWNNYMDFGHGAGHGVGYCLSVHEGPNNISPKSSYKFSDEGVVTTIEPGFYKENEFGIRLENMTVTIKQGDYLAFETLNFFPFELDAINIDMLTKDEIKWLNNYHKETYNRLSPFLKEPVAKWLKKATRMI
jgi:Xaa-Pro aminopeptidase